MLLRLWVCYFLLSCGLEVAKLAAEALFLSRAGVKWLPTVFGFQALANAGAAGIYAALATRWNSTRVFVGLIAGFGVAMCGTAAAVAMAPGFWAYGVLYGCAEVGATLLKIHWGVYILELYRPTSAARLFPFLYTAAALGRSGGGALVREGSGVVDLEWLTCLSLAICIALAVAALKGAARKARTVVPEPEPVPDSPDNDERAGDGGPVELDERDSGADAQEEEDFAKPAEERFAVTTSQKRPEPTVEMELGRQEQMDKSPETELPEWATGDLYARGWTRRLRHALGQCVRSDLLRAIALATILMVLVRYCTRNAYMVVFQAHLKEQALARLLGTYSIVANLAGLFLQLVLVPRILRKFGIQAANLAYAVALTAGLAVISVSGHLWAAVAARFMDYEFKSAVKTPVSPIFYFGVPSAQRAEARAFILGAVVPAATILINLAQQVARQYLDFQTLAIGGLVLGGVYVLAAHWQNRAYGQARRTTPDAHRESQ